MQNLTDEQLAKLSQSGDKTAQEQLFLRYKKLVRACARKYFLKGGDEEDLIQVGMIGLLQAIENYKEEGKKSFKNFVYLCVLRRIIDEVKKTVAPKTEQFACVSGISDLEIDPEQELINEDERRELNELMSRTLTNMEFKIFTMFLDGVTYTAIGDSIGKEYKSVDNAVQRSKMKLRKVLADKNKTTEKE